jgi:hypothetical protein
MIEHPVMHDATLVSTKSHSTEDGAHMVVRKNFRVIIDERQFLAGVHYGGYERVDRWNPNFVYVQVTVDEKARITQAQVANAIADARKKGFPIDSVHHFNYGCRRCVIRDKAELAKLFRRALRLPSNVDVIVASMTDIGRRLVGKPSRPEKKLNRAPYELYELCTVHGPFVVCEERYVLAEKGGKSKNV